MKRPLFVILLSTLLISGTSWGAWALYRGWIYLQEQDPRFLVRAILVKSLSEDGVKPGMIAEWLHLTAEHPYNLYAIPLKQAEKVILEQSHVKYVKVSRLPPATLLVEIELKKPIALLGEWTNRAIDVHGDVFPLLPFYTPKKLPRLFLGSKSQFAIAQEILEVLKEKGEPLYALDMERAEATSFGEREIVLNVGGTLLRLDADNWREGLAKWSKLKESGENIKIADLRIANLALVSFQE